MKIQVKITGESDHHEEHLNTEFCVESGSATTLGQMVEDMLATQGILTQSARDAADSEKQLERVRSKLTLQRGITDGVRESQGVVLRGRDHALKRAAAWEAYAQGLEKMLVGSGIRWPTGLRKSRPS